MPQSITRTWRLLAKPANACRGVEVMAALDGLFFYVSHYSHSFYASIFFFLHVNIKIIYKN